MTNKKIKKSLDYANKEKIPYVIIYGEDEVNNKVFKVKDMFNNKEIEVLFDEISDLKKVLGI